MPWSEWVDALLRQAGLRSPAEPPAAVRPARVWPTPEWLATRPDLALALALFERLETLGGPDRAAAAEAARAIAGVMHAVPPGRLARLDEELRRLAWFWGMQGRPEWVTDAAAVAGLELSPDAEPWVLGLVALHPSGHAREAAVQRLSDLRTGAELPFLLLRANDWVEPVRRAAARAVEARAVPGYGAHFVRSLVLVLRLKESMRADSRALVGDVLALLCSAPARPALRAGLRSPERRVRRTCFALLSGETRGDVLREVVFLGLRAPDPGVRRSAARQAYRLDLEGMEAVLPELMRGGPAAVRMDGVMIAAKVGPDGDPFLGAGAFDRSEMVRTAARAFLKLQGGARDFAAFYRAALDDGSAPREGAVLGLGETGKPDDLPRVERLLADPRPRVRIAALEAALKLGRDAALPAVAELLADPSARVSRAARRALERRPVDPSALEALFEGEHPAHVRKNALLLLARRSKWVAVPWIVRGCGDAEPAVAKAGRRSLRRWRARFDRAFETPTPGQLSRLGAALSVAGEAIDAETRKWLRSLVLDR